ncbi:hypothetical protein RYX36_003174, partial [Vicia faba]
MVDQIESCSPNTLVQCRICHDEDEDLNMDTPCSCSGTLQYAHRICVQRWCNEKGDTTCEICQQQFKGYTAPQAPLFHYRYLIIYSLVNFLFYGSNDDRRLLIIFQGQLGNSKS